MWNKPYLYVVMLRVKIFQNEINLNSLQEGLIIKSPGHIGKVPEEVANHPFVRLSLQVSFPGQLGNIGAATNNRPTHMCLLLFFNMGDSFITRGMYICKEIMSTDIKRFF